MGHFSVSSSSHWASLQSTWHLLSFAGDNWFNNKYSMCTVTSILSHISGASVSISLVTRPILDGWVWVVMRLHLAGLASHSWHSSLHLKSWITSHFCESWLPRLLNTMLCICSQSVCPICAVNTPWCKHRWVRGGWEYLLNALLAKDTHVHLGLAPRCFAFV